MELEIGMRGEGVSRMGGNGVNVAIKMYYAVIQEMSSYELRYQVVHKFLDIPYSSNLPERSRPLQISVTL